MDGIILDLLAKTPKQEHTHALSNLIAWAVTALIATTSRQRAAELLYQMADRAVSNDTV